MSFKEILEVAALVLSIVNALILIQNFLRDRAKLVVKPVHPDVYQWWFHLPDGTYEGKPTRRYGFLVYVGIANCGTRKVAVDSWRLFMQTHGGRRRQELKPLTISEPVVKLKAGSKAYSVLGITGQYGSGETTIEPGCTISGWAYYLAEYWGDANWNPVIERDVIKGEFAVSDVLGGSAKTQILFSEKDLEYIKDILPDIIEVGNE